MKKNDYGITWFLLECSAYYAYSPTSRSSFC